MTTTPDAGWTAGSPRDLPPGRYEVQAGGEVLELLVWYGWPTATVLSRSSFRYDDATPDFWEAVTAWRPCER